MSNHAANTIEPTADGYIIVRNRLNGPRYRYYVEGVIEASDQWITFDGWRVNLGNGKPSFKRKRYSFHRSVILGYRTGEPEAWAR